MQKGLISSSMKIIFPYSVQYFTVAKKKQQQKKSIILWFLQGTNIYKL